MQAISTQQLLYLRIPMQAPFPRHEIIPDLSVLQCVIVIWRSCETIDWGLKSSHPDPHWNPSEIQEPGKPLTLATLLHHSKFPDTVWKSIENIEIKISHQIKLFQITLEQNVTAVDCGRNAWMPEIQHEKSCFSWVVERCLQLVSSFNNVW